MTAPESSSCCDNAGFVCRASDNPRLPRQARLPINRCNLPADILGSLTFQGNPCALAIDGVAELHQALFSALDRLASTAARAAHFEDYLTVHFRLHRPDEMGLTPGATRDRHKAIWLRVLRGWLFDADSIEAAVLKGWVESRFGLLPRYHRAPLRDPGDLAWRRYQEDRTRGLYGTSALEAQLDLLFAFTQYEFSRSGDPECITLYRGVNRAQHYETIRVGDGGHAVWLLNNLNSFCDSAERAGEFGDRIIRVEVPRTKIFCHSRLLPRRLKGEEEFLVIGGLYRIEELP